MAPSVRKKIPAPIEFDVLQKSRRLCCICKKRGDHIHHIDGNPSNNTTDNLALLCFDDHHDATVKGGLRRGLNKEMVIRFRNQHYKDIAAEKAQSIKIVTKAVTKITTEDLLQAALDAIIILELEEIKSNFHNSDWDGKEVQLGKLNKFTAHASDRAVYEVLSFLEGIASLTRMKIPESLSIEVTQMAMAFFPTSYIRKNKKHDLETGKLCLAIGFSTAYDCAIKLKRLSLIPYGLTVWKHVYRYAKSTKNLSLLKEVEWNYDRMEDTLQRPERNDLIEALELVRTFRADLQEGSLSFPPYSNHIMKRIRLEEHALSSQT